MSFSQLSAQVDGPTTATISELLRLNKENTVKIDKILGILAAKGKMDSKLNYLPNEPGINGDECNENAKPRLIRKAHKSAKCSSSSMQSLNKRRRFSSLGEVNHGFEDIQLSEPGPLSRHDMIVDIMRGRRCTIRRSSSAMSIQAFKFLKSARSSERSESFNQRGSNGSISL